MHSRCQSLAVTAILTLLLPHPALAQSSDPDAKAAAMVEQTKDYFGTRVARRGCEGPSDTGEIVVCGYRRPDPRFERPEAPQTNDSKMVAMGAPPAGGGVGGSVTVRGCFLQKCPKPLYFIDMKAIPEPAPGSEAYAIAHGEAPAP